MISLLKNFNFNEINCIFCKFYCWKICLKLRRKNTLQKSLLNFVQKSFGNFMLINHPFPSMVSTFWILNLLYQLVLCQLTAMLMSLPCTYGNIEFERIEQIESFAEILLLQHTDSQYQIIAENSFFFFASSQISNFLNIEGSNKIYSLLFSSIIFNSISRYLHQQTLPEYVVF